MSASTLKHMERSQFLGNYLAFRVFEAERTGPPDVRAAGRGLLHRFRVEALHSAGAARLRAGLRVLVSKHVCELRKPVFTKLASSQQLHSIGIEATLTATVNGLSRT